MTEQQLLIPMDIGERLGKARRERRLSVESCAAALKVPVDILVAIEAEEFERFAPIYRKGYIQAYARHLGMEAEEIQTLLDSLSAPEPELKPVFMSSAPAPSSDRWLRAASYVLASLLIGTLGWQLTHEAVRLYQVDRIETAAEGATGESHGVEMAVPARQSHVNASIASLEELGRQRGEENLDPSRAAWSALNEQQNEDEGLPPGHHSLKLMTSGDSWVEIMDATGEQLEMDLVRGGSERTYQGVTPFRVQFGRASAVNIFMDGHEIDLSSFTAGDVLQMSLDESLISGPAEPDPDSDG